MTIVLTTRKSKVSTLYNFIVCFDISRKRNYMIANMLMKNMAFVLLLMNMD